MQPVNDKQKNLFHALNAAFSPSQAASPAPSPSPAAASGSSLWESLKNMIAGSPEKANAAQDPKQLHLINGIQPGDIDSDVKKYPNTYNK